MKADAAYKWLGWTVALILAIQMYFVKEMLAAEVMFSLAFVVITLSAAVFYALSAIGGSSVRAAQSLVRGSARAAQTQRTIPGTD